MALEPINVKLVSIALDEIDTAGFERFSQCFYGALIGTAFIPLGGMHDGGAEGYIEPEISEDATATHFIQVSKQETVRKKIRQTASRLREYGRDPKTLTYITSRTVTDTDKEETLLSDELGIRVRIRDQKYIESQINASDQTIACFNSILAPALAHLGVPGAANTAPGTTTYADRTLAVFLRQEVDNRLGKADLLESVSDSLIIWALSETDPDKGLFLDRDAILVKIEQALPSARHFIRGVIDDRLDKLRDKSNTQGRQIRHYRKGEKYCLPYETRALIAEENINDLTCKSDAEEALRRRCEEFATDNEKSLVSIVVELCGCALQRIFEKQGLQVAQFATSGEVDVDIFANAADIIAEEIDRADLKDDALVVRRLAGPHRVVRLEC